MANKRHRSKTGRILFTLLLIIIGVPMIGLALFLMTFDVNSYRGQIEDALLAQTGRTIKLGPITWSLSLDHGFSLAASDISVSNPSWASRPDMAHIGTAKLHLDVRSLAQRKVNIIAFELAKTDVQLESGTNGAVNWDFTPPPSPKADSKTSDQKNGQPTKASAPVTINVSEVKITDSRFGLKGKEGKLSVFDVPDLLFKNTDKGVNLHFKGTAAGIPAEIDLKGGRMEQLAKSDWPFTMQARYNGLKAEAHGTVTNAMKNVDMDTFVLTAGESDLSGQLKIALGGARPTIEGKLHGKQIDLHDFVIDKEESTAESKSGSATSSSTQPSDKMFSNEPLALDSLKTADALLDLSVDKFAAGLTSAQNLTAKIVLKGGHLTVAPVTAQIAGSKTDFSLTVDASSPTALITTSLKSPSLDLSQLFKMGGMESAISGKTDVDIDLTTSGRSTHDFAAHANGKINLLMDSGLVSSSLLSELAGSLMNIFAPGASALKPGINCMAARYVVTNGLMDTKGLLIDTEVTTIAGKGFLNLPDEHISMSLFTKPKGLGLTSMIPPMRIAGSLKKPSFTLDAAGAVQKLTGILTNNNSLADSGVPTMATAVPGKNACALTLDNPGGATAPNRPPLIPAGVGDIKNNIKDIGNKLLNGLGSGLLGN